MLISIRSPRDRNGVGFPNLLLSEFREDLAGWCSWPTNWAAPPRAPQSYLDVTMGDLAWAWYQLLGFLFSRDVVHDKHTLYSCEQVSCLPSASQTCLRGPDWSSDCSETVLPVLCPGTFWVSLLAPRAGSA